MKAIFYSGRGAAREVLGIDHVPAPVATADEVLVKVFASGANPSDVKTRQGNLGPMTVPRTIPHSDGAGIIEAVGEGVSKRRVGEKVWLNNVNRTPCGMGQGEHGTAAEFVAVDRRLAVPLTHGVSFEEGACLGVPAMTAHRALFANGPVAGKTVLITGGAGAVGSMAIQMAKYRGAKVITTVSGEEKAEAAREDGADVIINYKTEPLAERVLDANSGEKLDHIVDVDFGVHVNITPDILKPDAMIAAYASTSAPQPAIDYYPLMFNNTGIQLVFVYAMSWRHREAAQSDIDQMLRDGALRPRIAKTYTLDQTIEAHEHIETGTQIGNVIVTISHDAS